MNLVRLLKDRPSICRKPSLQVCDLGAEVRAQSDVEDGTLPVYWGRRRYTCWATAQFTGTFSRSDRLRFVASAGESRRPEFQPKRDIPRQLADTGWFRRCVSAAKKTEVTCFQRVLFLIRLKGFSCLRFIYSIGIVGDGCITYGGVTASTGAGSGDEPDGNGIDSSGVTA